MGTYGVTHVKKDNKIIPFSDSYDGYWSGMGQANIIGLKHIGVSKLSQLFDSFTARQALSADQASSFVDSGEHDSQPPLNQRHLHNFIEQVAVDTNQNQEAIDWAKNITSGDISTSCVGVVPLLYMNIHPHYGYDYDYADYVIDLDKQAFIFTNTNLEIPLDLIKQTPLINLYYFFENDYSLINIGKYFPESFNSIEDLLYKVEPTEQDVTLQNVHLLIKEIFSIPSQQVQSYFDKKEQQRQAWVAENTPVKFSEDTIDDKDEFSYSYSLYTAEVGANQLRNIVYFLQEKSKQPGYEFIIDCAEWGLDENYIQGVIRLQTPTHNQYQEKFVEIIHTLESSLKQRFNIMSRAGFGFGDSIDSEKNSTLQKSIFSFEELENILSKDDLDIVMSEGLPYLAYHSYLDQASEHIIKHKDTINSPIFWIFVSLVSQNINLFNAVYKQSKNQLATLSVEDQEKVKNLYLSSYYDGQSLTQVLNKTSTFMADLQKTSLFNDCYTLLNDIEIKNFLS